MVHSWHWEGGGLHSSEKCAAQLSSGSILVKVDFLPQDDEHCREAHQGVLTTSRFYLSGAAVMHDHQSRVDSALGRGAILKKALCAIQGRPIRWVGGGWGHKQCVMPAVGCTAIMPPPAL